MKKLILFTFFFILLMPVALRAQSAGNFALGFGADAVLPFNTTNGAVGSKQFYKDGAGVFVNAELPLPDRFALTFSAGYIAYGAKPTTSYTPSGVYFTCLGCSVPETAVTTNHPDYKYVPVKAGLRYYVSDFYLQAEIGAAFGAGDNATSSVFYACGAGWLFRLNRHNAIDLGAYFDRAFTSTDYNYLLSQADIRLAYRFAF